MIRKLYYRYKSFRFLKRILKEDEDINFEWLCRTGFYQYRKHKKNSCERNLVAAVIKKYRQKYPYHIKGWAENQKIYEEYFTLPGAIKSTKEAKQKWKKDKELFVTLFRDKSIYKGEKLFQYNSVGTYLKEPVVYKIFDFKNEYGRLGKNTFMNLTEEWLTAFRYSTPEEIINYKLETSRKKEIQERIDLKQKEISELYKQLKNWKYQK